MRCMTPSTRSKELTPPPSTLSPKPQPAQSPSGAALEGGRGGDRGGVGQPVVQNHFLAVPTQSPPSHVVPANTETFPQLSASPNPSSNSQSPPPSVSTSSPGGGPVEDYYPPPQPLWINLNNTTSLGQQRRTPSSSNGGGEWWRISQSAV